MSKQTQINDLQSVLNEWESLDKESLLVELITQILTDKQVDHLHECIVELGVPIA